MEYSVKQLIDPNDKDLANVLNLFKGIPGRTCSAAAYLEYLNNHWLLIGLFVVIKDDKIIGFTQAEAPGTLEPKTAWLPFSHALPECPHEQAVKAVELATEWMKGFGATKFKVTTVRKTKAFEKTWGMKRSKEVLMEKDI